MNQTSAVRTDDTEKYLLYAKLDNAKILHNLAKAVSFKDVKYLKPSQIWPFLIRFIES